MPGLDRVEMKDNLRMAQLCSIWSPQLDAIAARLEYQLTNQGPGPDELFKQDDGYLHLRGRRYRYFTHLAEDYGRSATWARERFHRWWTVEDVFPIDRWKKEGEEMPKLRERAVRAGSGS